ncbi:MAG: hypothetical protein WCW56_03390 [Candidatus Paceibacterota bacterium]
MASGDAGGLKYDNAGVLRAVNVNWNDDGWNVNANSVENPNDWNDGNQVFSRNCCFSPAIGSPICREFLFAILFSIRQVVGQFHLIFELARRVCLSG